MNPRAASFAVAIMAAFSLQGCATMRAAGPGLIDCAAPMMSLSITRLSSEKPSRLACMPADS